MKKLTMAIALTGSGLMMSACAEEVDETADAADAADAAATQEVDVNLPATMPATETPPADTGGGDSVRIGPGGAEVDINDGGTNVKLNAGKNPSLEVEVD